MKMLFVGLAGLLFSLSSISKTEAQIMSTKESSVIVWENKCPVGGYYDYKHPFNKSWKKTVSADSKNICTPPDPNYKHQAGPEWSEIPEELVTVKGQNFTFINRDYKHYFF